MAIKLEKNRKYYRKCSNNFVADCAKLNDCNRCFALLTLGELLVLSLSLWEPVVVADKLRSVFTLIHTVDLTIIAQLVLSCKLLLIKFILQNRAVRLRYDRSARENIISSKIIRALDLIRVKKTHTYCSFMK